MIYVVLGMHKSGTTLVSQILHTSGINMVQDSSKTYDEGNQYERESFRRINNAILNCEDLFSLNVTDRALAPFLDNPDPEVEETVRLEVTRLSGMFANWGFKDPRTCYTYPFWKDLLPPHKIIAIYRSPYDLWKRYKKSYRVLKFRGAWRLIRRWGEHNQNIIDFVSQQDVESLTLDYHKLMTDDATFSRLQDFVGIELNDARKPQLYRNQAATTGLVSVFDRLNVMLGRKSIDEILQDIRKLSD